MEFRFEDVVKILEHCSGGSCKGCPCEGQLFECDEVMFQASKLLREQKILIENLMKVNDDHRALNGKLRKKLDSSKFSYIYKVETELDCEVELFQYHDDALKYAMRYIEEVASDDDWDVEDLENALNDISGSDVCSGVVRIEMVEVK